jgi:hypothetical protein
VTTGSPKTAVDAVGGAVATFPEAAGVVSLPPAVEATGESALAGDSAGPESVALVVAVSESSSSLHAGANAARIAAAQHHRLA